MLKTAFIAVTTCCLAFASGCSQGEDIELKGELTAVATVAGPVTVSFYELPKEVSAEPLLVKQVELAALGAFTQQINVSEGTTKLRVFALEDKNGDDKCSAGELWAQVELTKATAGFPAANLALKADPCPAP